MTNNQTPRRSIRIETTLWHQLQTTAKTHGQTATSIIRQLITNWLTNPTNTPKQTETTNTATTRRTPITNQEAFTAMARRHAGDNT